MTVSRWILLGIRNVSDKAVEKIKTHILCSISVLRTSAIYKKMWKNTVGPDRTQMTM
jgi:hypothetical protein